MQEQTALTKDMSYCLLLVLPAVPACCICCPQA
jgi:hypothetical protein